MMTQMFVYLRFGLSRTCGRGRMKKILHPSDERGIDATPAGTRTRNLQIVPTDHLNEL